MTIVTINGQPVDPELAARLIVYGEACPITTNNLVSADGSLWALFGIRRAVCIEPLDIPLIGKSARDYKLYPVLFDGSVIAGQLDYKEATILSVVRFSRRLGVKENARWFDTWWLPIWRRGLVYDANELGVGKDRLVDRLYVEALG